MSLAAEALPAAPATESVAVEVGHISAIEGLRGVAVLWVVLFHYVSLRPVAFDDPWVRLLAAAGTPMEVVLRNGYLGVDLFFAITGFLLVLPWFRHAAEGRPAPSARGFYIRRLRRILPAYWVQLAFLFFVFVPMLLGLGHWLRDLGFLSYNLFTHIFFLHYTTPLSSASLGINGALWSLALEMQYYLLLPLLAPIMVRRPYIGAALLVAAAHAWRLASAHDLAPLVDFEMGLAARWQVPESAIRHFIATQLPGYLAHFAVGILCGRAWLLWKRRERPRGVEDLAWNGLALASLGLLYYAHKVGSLPYLGSATWLATIVSIGGAMLAWVSRGTSLTGPLLANAPIAFVGRISYSAYLYHLPLLMAWNKFVPASWGWFSAPLYLALVTGVSWLSWRFVEAPFLRKPPNGTPKTPS